eukprot:5407767-Amphidinium_carterae.1
MGLLKGCVILSCHQSTAGDPYRSVCICKNECNERKYKDQATLARRSARYQEPVLQLNPN